MRITSMSARVLAAMMAVGSVVAFAGSYQWSGGDGRWADVTRDMLEKLSERLL